MVSRGRQQAQRGRSGVIAGVVTALVAGSVMWASPATAADDCAPASAPPSANTWYNDAGEVRGTRVLSRENWPTGGPAIGATVVYETRLNGVLRRETWELRRVLPPQRTECQEVEKPVDEKPATTPRTGGAGREGTGGGGGGLGAGAWSGGGGGGVGIVTVGKPVQDHK